MKKTIQIILVSALLFVMLVVSVNAISTAACPDTVCSASEINSCPTDCGNLKGKILTNIGNIEFVEGYMSDPSSDYNIRNNLYKGYNAKYLYTDGISSVPQISALASVIEYTLTTPSANLNTIANS